MKTQRTLTFRPVRSSDLPTICTFPQNATELYFMFPKASYPLTPEQLQSAIDQRHESTVVLADEEICGFANFNIFEPGQRCSIGNVIVSPAFRSQGIGRELVSRMIHKAFIEFDVQRVELACFNHNTTGLLFYPKLGFQPTSLEERIDWQGNQVVSIYFSLSRADWFQNHSTSLS